MRYKVLAAVAVVLLVIGSIACDTNDTINIPSEDEIFTAEVAVAVLSVIEDINAIKLIEPEEEEPEPDPGLGEPDPEGPCEIIQNSTEFYCNISGDIQDCGEDLFSFNSCRNTRFTSTTESNGDLVIVETEIWPTGDMNMLLETLVSEATYDMTFDGTPEVVTVYSDGMITRYCLVTLTSGVGFNAVATCEDLG